MSILSANTLFHFTSSIENLLSILKNGFRPRYCIEDISILESNKWFVPMICFSDIPLSQIEEHSSWYGEYAIGISKEWGIKKSINPVLYINQDSPLIENIKECIQYTLGNVKDAGNCPREAKTLFNLTYQYSFYKPYTGMQFKKAEERMLTKRFYDEREWRYVPQDCENKKSLLKQYSQEKNESWNDEVISYAIFPDPQYINYIIVSKEEEVLGMVDKLQILEDKYQNEHIRKLATRIISMERIKQDF